jgi:hypothetical protein
MPGAFVYFIHFQPKVSLSFSAFVLPINGNYAEHEVAGITTAVARTTVLPNVKQTAIFSLPSFRACALIVACRVKKPFYICPLNEALPVL